MTERNTPELQRRRGQASARLRRFVDALLADPANDPMPEMTRDMRMILDELYLMRQLVEDFAEAWGADTCGDMAERLNFGEVEPLAALFAVSGRHVEAFGMLEAWMEGEEDFDPDDDDEWGAEIETITEYREIAALQIAFESEMQNPPNPEG